MSYATRQDGEGNVIEFYLDTKSGVAPYLQLVQQVRRALKLGLIGEGDRLPTIKEVVGTPWPQCWG